MPAYRLHYFPESGNSYKLALMLTLCGETFEPVWTDFGGGVTRTAEWRRSQRDGRNSGAGGGRRTADPNRADPAATRRTVWPVRRRDAGREVRAITLAILGQPQAHRLHGDLSILPHVHARSRSACPKTFSPAARRLSWNSRAAHEKELLRDRRAAEHR